MTGTSRALLRGSRAIPVPAAAVGAPLLVAAAAVALWLAWGVRASEIGVFLAYELAFVVVPGWLVYRAVMPVPGGALRQVVLGWSLGYLLEILAFMASGAIGARSAFLLYPVLVAAPAAAVLWRRRRAQEPDSPPDQAAQESTVPTWPLWAGALLCVLLLVYASGVGFSQTPLPRDVESATYQEDTVYAISLAAEALHHWPVTTPTVAGEPLDYHLFVYLHMAAINDVTGIDLSVVVMRLYQVPVLVLFALQLVWAGRRLGGRISTGIVAAFVVLFLGELDPASGLDFPFGDLFFYWLLASHTFLLGLIFFVPAIMILAELVAPAREPRQERVRRWVLFAAFLAACVGAKSYAPLLVLAGGLGVFLVWHLAARRTIDRAAAAALGLSAAAYLAANAFIFGWNTGGATISPFSSFERMPGILRIDELLGRGTEGQELGVLDVVLGTGGLLGIPLLGIGLLLAYRRLSLSTSEALFLSFFVASLPALFLLVHPGLSHLFVLFYGVTAGALVASAGLTLYWQRHGRDAVGIATIGLLAVGAWAVATYQVSDTGLAPLGLALAGVTVVVLVVLGGRGSGRRLGRSALSIGVAGVLLLGVVNTPLDWIPTLASRAQAGEPLHSQEYHGLTAGLHGGLRWIRANTDADAVLVVNNHSLRPDKSDSKYFYYSAFAERRVVLESWDYTQQAAAREVFSVPEHETPFPERLRLSKAVFDAGDAAALDVLACEYGATHLVVDKAHGSAVANLGEVAGPESLVYSNWDIDVYRVTRPPPAGCA